MLRTLTYNSNYFDLNYLWIILETLDFSKFDYFVCQSSGLFQDLL